jgi:hypothetical protein
MAAAMLIRALFGAFGLLGIGLIYFCLRYVAADQHHNRRGRGRDEPVLGLLRRNLSHSRRRLRRLNREPSRASINSRLTILH